GIIFHAAKRDESAALKLASRGSGECLGIDVNRRFGLESQDAVAAPLPSIGGGPSVDIVARTIFGFSASQDDSHEVVRTGGVVTFLHRGGDLVVGLGHDLRSRDSLQVIAESAKGLDVCHGNV